MISFECFFSKKLETTIGIFGKNKKRRPYKPSKIRNKNGIKSRKK